MRAKIFFATVLVMMVVSVTTVQGAQKEGKVLTNRGCTACHVKESDKNDNSLGAKTREIETHPTEAPSGVKLDENVTVKTCLECHESLANGRGKKAKHSLRDIVHPVHNFSPIFKRKFNGNCFSCHNVDAEGNWVLLGKKIATNEKGIADDAPIPNVSQTKENSFDMASMLASIALALSVLALVLSIRRRK